MHKVFLSLLLSAVVWLMPLHALAVNEHDHPSDSPVASAQNSHRDHMADTGHHAVTEPEGPTETGTMAIVGSQLSKGVKGMAHLRDVSEAMVKLGLLTTHHFMIAFIDEKTGALVESGRVALKITNPDAKVSETIELRGMDGHFGADIVLDMKGEYHFKLGTELVDGVKRKYHFHHVIN